MPEPEGHGHHEGAKAPWRIREIALEDALEFEVGLVVEGDGIEIRWADSGSLQAEFDGVDGELVVVLDPGEALLLSRRKDNSIFYERRRAVVVEGGYPQDGCHSLHSSATTERRVAIPKARFSLAFPAVPARQWDGGVVLCAPILPVAGASIKFVERIVRVRAGWSFLGRGLLPAGDSPV